MAMLDSQQYPYKLCLIKCELDINVIILKTHYLQLWFSAKVTCAFLLQENIKGSLSELNTLNLKTTISSTLVIK